MPPELHLPDDMDINNPYNLFTLFFPKDLWSTIAINTNQYAKLKTPILHTIRVGDVGGIQILQSLRSLLGISYIWVSIKALQLSTIGGM
jgi:hypothetical protein